MKAIELKFLLKLLSYPNYQTTISNLQPDTKTSTSERTRICESLASKDNEFVGFSRKITRFSITPAGKGLLKQDSTELSLTEQQVTVLQACAKGSITSSSIKKLAAIERQSVIQTLINKGFIKVEKEQIEVWLTEKGDSFLRYECIPDEADEDKQIKFKLLKHYLNFLRKVTSTTRIFVPQEFEENEPSITSSVSSNTPTNKPDDDEVLDLIERLDQELKTENYLPIFYVREKLQPLFSRDELDQVLYRLQSSEKLELSSLVETVHYTPEQIQAGIPQESGGPLFFLQIL